MNYNIPIPKLDFPEEIYNFNFIDEPLICVSEYFSGKVAVEPVYYKQGIKGAVRECKIRLGAAKKLEKALYNLPDGYTFKIFDAWRPINVQQELFNTHYNHVLSAHKNWTEEQICTETKKFVSIPSYDTENPSVHNTGGAIDLTVISTVSGHELQMGTAFDDFTEKSHTDYFEDKNEDNIKQNRRILYWSMINAGFTNLPTEWWHFDYGTKFWSFYTKKPTLYKGTLNEC